jgi:hypothetical protein
MSTVIAAPECDIADIECRTILLARDLDDWADSIGNSLDGRRLSEPDVMRLHLPELRAYSERLAAIIGAAETLVKER